MTHPNPLRPYVYYTYTPKLRGRARQYSGHYVGHRIVETTDGLRPSIVTSRTVVRVVRDDGGTCTGTTERSRGVQIAQFYRALADHLNLLHQVRLGIARVTLARIVGETNAELQRELIEHYDGCGAGIDIRPRGWDTYIADVGASTIHADETGELIEIPTTAESIRAVRVICPSTGRRYALRVPPRTSSAIEGVAWTFGLTADQYQPVAQS